MAGFGTELMVTFLDKACPELANAPREYVSWSDVSELFFGMAGHFKNEAERTGRVWNDDAVDELDAALVGIAEAGQFDGKLSLSPWAAEELWRRWRYAIIAAELEDLRGPMLMLPTPIAASDAIKGAAVMLYILGGAAQDYPLSMIE